MREADLDHARYAPLDVLVREEQEARQRYDALTNRTRVEGPKRGVAMKDWLRAQQDFSDAFNRLLIRSFEEGMYLRDEADVLREKLDSEGRLWSGRLERNPLPEAS